jgi:hypothetical protein
MTTTKRTKRTTLDLIAIGFCQSKFYKRHVWRQAKVVMEWLADNTSHVIRANYGPGCGQYDRRINPVADVTHEMLASLYDAEKERQACVKLGKEIKEGKHAGVAFSNS